MYCNVSIKQCELKNIYVYGTVYYKDGLVAKDAIIIVEKIYNGDSCLIGYTVSDESGNFLVKLDDNNFYYRLSAFEGELNGKFYSKL